jgi:hypothetical protein
MRPQFPHADGFLQPTFAINPCRPSLNSSRGSTLCIRIPLQQT